MLHESSRRRSKQSTGIADRSCWAEGPAWNGVVVDPNGSIWLTDPIYGILGQYEDFTAASETKEADYQVDSSSGRIALVTDEVVQPNELCLSPDYSLLCVADTGAGETKVWDVDGARPGVLVIAPDGETIGVIRLPEVCANVCFGGPKRNRLFMTASQSLYAVYVGATGAHIC